MLLPQPAGLTEWIKQKFSPSCRGDHVVAAPLQSQCTRPVLLAGEPPHCSNATKLKLLGFEATSKAVKLPRSLCCCGLGRMKSIAQTVAHSRSLRNMTMRRTMAGSTCRAIGVAIGVRQSGSGSCEKINSPQIPVRQTKDLARRKELQKQLIHSFQSPNSAIGAIGVGQSGSGSCEKIPQGVNLRCHYFVALARRAQRTVKYACARQAARASR